MKNHKVKMIIKPKTQRIANQITKLIKDHKNKTKLMK